MHKPGRIDWTKTAIAFVTIFLLAEIFLYLATSNLDSCDDKKNSPYWSYLHNNYQYDLNGVPHPYAEYFDSLHKDQLPFGVTLWGYIRTQSELGESARKYAESIIAAGIPLVIFDFHYGLIPSSHRQLNSTKLEPYIIKDFNYTSRYFINIFVNEPSMTHQLFEDRIPPRHFRPLKNCYNIAVWAWDLDMVPAKWTPDFRYYDEIWTESTFIADTFRKAAPIPVQPVFYGIGNYVRPTKHDEDVGREFFGIPPTAFVVYYSFDYLGQLERENPEAVIEAFSKFYNILQQTEHTTTPDVVLVLETSEAGRNYFPMLQRQKNITGMASALPKNAVKFIDRYSLSDQQQDSLYEQVDVYLALHRSEGFSYVLAHFMQLGKPVISTNYSGPADIINPDVAFVVPYTLVPLEEHYPPYEKGNQWAVPDIAVAAEQLEFVYKYREEAAEKGKRAQAFIEANYDEEKTGNIIKTKLQRLWDGNAVQYLTNKQIHAP